MHQEKSKCYPSIFDPSIQTDIANYLTEILIVNFLKWQKKPMPSSPFWRKDIATGDKGLAELSKKYQVELVGVRNLLTLFSPKVLAEDFINNRRVGVKMVKKETQQKILFDLYQLHLKYDKLPKSEHQDVIMYTEVQSSMPKTNKLKNLL